MPEADPLEQWADLPIAIEKLAEQLAEHAKAAQAEVSSIYTSVPLGVWIDPATEKYALEIPEDATSSDIILVKDAVERIGELGDVPPSIDAGHVKVAYSPTLNWAGRQTGYLPSWPDQDQWDVVPGHGPVQGALASGLLGAGLGYGAGWLGEKFLPEKWKRKRLRRTLGILGGVVGATPGLIWAGTNMATGKAPWNNDIADQTGRFEGDLYKQNEVNELYKEASLAGPALLWAYRRAAFEEAWAEVPDHLDKTASFRSPLSIDLDVLGNDLHEVGADPATMATAMSTLYAAHQMPGGDQRQGFVTPSQMARLGVHMGAGYVSGSLVGAALGILTGMPDGPKNRLKQTGMYLGAVRAVVPKLFGG